jgi:nucleoside-diphosphate-sugar epimerase
LVLVTGCAGFIGSHLTERLLKIGHDVIGVDSLTDYYDPDLKFHNLSACLDDSRFRFVRSPLCGLEDHIKTPHSPYGVTKLAAEHLCSLYAANYGFPAVSLRLFTVCGPRQRPDMMFHRLIWSALTGTRFTLYGDGGMERDFTNVFDIVDALIAAGKCTVEQRVFNIAGGHTVSVRQAINLVEELTGAKISIDYRPERRGDVRRTGADISAALRQLNYQPKRSIRESLQSQIESLAELQQSKLPVVGAAV